MKTGAPTAAARLPGRNWSILAITGVLMWQAALAQGGTDQRAMLDFDSGRQQTALAIEQAVREGDPWEQLSWTFTLRPSALYRQYLDERGGDLFNPRLSATLQLRFGEKPIDSIRRAVKLERALHAHARAGRLEVRNALLAHAELLLAQDAERLAREALAVLPVDAPALERQAAELAVRTEEADLAAARRDAAVYGFTGTATYSSIRFGLPDSPRVSDLSPYRLQELAVAEAEAQYVAAGAASVLRDFRLGAGIRGEFMDFDLETGLMAGRPGLRVSTIHPGGRARMEIRVSAEIAIGDGLRDLPYLAAEVEREQQELERLALEMQAEWLVALEAVSLAAAELDLAEAELAEAALARDEVVDAVLLMPADADERERERLQTSVGRAEREVQRLQTRVYRAWINYVRRQHEVVEAAGSGWVP